MTLFPEGTRTSDGDLGELKSGIALLATKAKVPIVPAAIAGTFEAWPRSRIFPVPHPIRVHFGQPIPAEQIKSLPPEALTALIRERILECQAIARRGLDQRNRHREPVMDVRSLGLMPRRVKIPDDRILRKTDVGRIGGIG